MMEQDDGSRLHPGGAVQRGVGRESILNEA